MTLTPLQTLGIILAVAAGTQLTRWLPFWLFPEKKQPPAVVAYLGKVLPPAMMGLLVVYCLRSISWLSAPHGAPELIAIAAVAGLHLWKRNVLPSIAGGTVLYMVLVQAVFVRKKRRDAGRGKSDRHFSAPGEASFYWDWAPETLAAALGSL